MNITKESKLKTNSANFDLIFPILETYSQTDRVFFSVFYRILMLLSYIFGPSVVKYGILSNNRCRKPHADTDCIFFNLTHSSWLFKHRPYKLKKNFIFITQLSHMGKIYKNPPLPASSVPLPYQLFPFANILRNIYQFSLFKNTTFFFLRFSKKTGISWLIFYAQTLILNG